MRTPFRLLVIFTAISLAFVSSAQAAGPKAQDGVRRALAELDAWLGKGVTQQGWSSYLNLPAVRESLDKGDQADRAAIGAVLEKLAGKVPGLEKPRFVRLREALARWNAELAITQAPSLSDAVLAASGEFRPITEEDRAQSRAALVAATRKLGDYLTGSNGKAWKDYLQFSNLEAQLASENPQVDVLAAVYRKLTANQVGLEMPVFANVADAIERYVYDLTGKDEKLNEQFNERLKTLAEALKKFGEAPSDDNAQAVGSQLGWLESMRQLPTLVEVVRGRLSRPNLLVVASERLVGAGIRQPVDEITPVRDYILGTSIRGDGHMRGEVAVELVPSDASATLDIMLSGLVNSRTVGQNGPATIYSNGATAVAGRKRVILTDAGVASYPSTAAANTNTRVTGIGGSGIVQRVASRRIGEQKRQAELIAADHAADRLRERMDAQINRQMAEAHANYLKKVKHPLIRRREFPDINLRTSSEELFLQVLAANRNQLAAPTAPPEVTAAGDLAVQVHESMINNLAATLLGGVTLEEEELQKQVIEMRGSLPEALESDEDKDPWSITFARSQPVTVTFTDGGLSITVRGSRYTSGDQDFRAMNVTAHYKIGLSDPDANGIRGIKLVRQGDLEIVPPGEPRRLSGREITLRTLLQKRFGKLFEPEVVYDGLVLPGRWREAGILDTKQLNVGGGWMVLALLQSGVPAPPEEDRDQPRTKEQQAGAGDSVTQAAN